MPKEILVEGTSAAPPAEVWARIVDGERWPELSPLESFKLEKHGDFHEVGEGIGAIRVFGTGRIRSREEIVERVERRRFAYVLLSGLAIEDYRAEIDLTQTPDGGSHLRWRSTFAKGSVPGTGWLYKSGIRKSIEPLVQGLLTGRRP